MPAAVKVSMHTVALPSVRRQAGLSLIELMIAVTVALVLVAALAVMFGSSIKARNLIEHTNRQIENGRFAVQLLRDDIQLAGYFGELNLVDLQGLPSLTTFTAMPDVCVTHETTGAPIAAVVTTNIAGDNVVNGVDYLATLMQMHVQGFNDVDPDDLPDCLKAGDIEVREGTDIIVVRRVRTCTADLGDADNDNCAFNEDSATPYLQASQCNDQTELTELAGDPLHEFRLLATVDDGDFDRLDINCGAARTPVRQYVTHIYFIDSNNVVEGGKGDGIPTLKRRELIGSGFRTTALVEGIEDLQFEYGVDALPVDVNVRGDGIPEGNYVSDPGTSGVPATDAQGWADVMSVRVHLLSRSTEPRPGYVDNNDYELGSKTLLAADRSAVDKRYTRQVFQTVIQLRNPMGRRQ